MISGNMVGSYSQMGKTFVIVDENGNEIAGVVTDNPVIFTATDNDVREGTVYASDSGISTGTKVIPSYHSLVGKRKITSGSVLKIPFYDSLNLYDYTELQGLVCEFHNSTSDSVAATMSVIDDTVYPVGSTEERSKVIKDHEKQTINLGVTNTSENAVVVRYFLYKEIE